jgi:hypothetical protein
MAKAEIKTPSGMHIIIEGSITEVADIVKSIQQKESSENLKKAFAKKNGIKKIRGLTDMIIELRESEFFKEPKSLIDVKNELAKKGYHYPATTISPTLVRLVRQGLLGRIAKDKIWGYVQR